jgi:hypothetical protein
MPEPVSVSRETVSPQSQEVSKPWELEGISRATWFRHKAANNKNIQAAEIPADEIPPEANLTVEGGEFRNVAAPEPAIEATTQIEPQPELNFEAVQQAKDAALNADEAAQRLKEQIAAFNRAEEMQRQHQAAMMAMAQHVPVTREQKLDAWRSQGMTQAEEAFLNQHPEMVDHPQVLTAAIGTTMRSGVSRDAPEFFDKVKSNFNFHLRRFQQQAAAQSPEFFRPPPTPAPARPTSASYVSAPVSRDVPSVERSARPPSKVTLSAEELEAARFSGVSPETYAKNKLRLMSAKARGEIP